MPTGFHARLYGRFIEIQSNLRRRKLHRARHQFFFNFSIFQMFWNNRDNEKAPIQFRRKRQPRHLKRWFSWIDLSAFISIAPVLLDQSSKTCWVFPALKPKSYFLHKFTVSRRSYSSSEANSSCYHRSDAWI